MTVHAPPRGGAPVGMLAELPAVEVGAVLYLRLWCDGQDSQRRIRADFAATLGAGAGDTAWRCFEDLCSLCVRHGRRPLMRHHLGCKCLGADEACFANFIAAAGEGQREDAMLLASLIVRPDMAPCLVGLAERFGLTLRRMALSAAPETTPGTHRNLH